MRVLITRPAEDAERTADALRAAGHEPLFAPIFKIKPLPHVVSSGLDALIATSANALRQAKLGAISKTTPLFTVGDATAHEARRCGFSHVTSAGGDSSDLAALLRSVLQAGSRVGWLVGKHRRDEAIRMLQDGFTISVIETYENFSVETLPVEIAEAVMAKKLDAILHFSSRSAEIFTGLVRQAGIMHEAQSLLHVFISAAAAAPAYPRQRIAASPDLRAMISALSGGLKPEGEAG